MELIEQLQFKGINKLKIISITSFFVCLIKAALKIKIYEYYKTLI